MGYNDIRAALSRGFYVTNLHQIARLCYELLESDALVLHPSIPYVIAATSIHVGSYFEGQPVRNETAAVIEAHVKPKMEAVIDADDKPELLSAAIDELARAYVDALPFLRSIGT